MTFGDDIAGILDDHDRAVPKWAGLLGEIMEDLARLEFGLADMKLECLRLAEAGMWSAVPTESWEGRNGSDPVYLRLLFPAGTNGLHRYRVYIGSKPERIADARRKTANRQRWEKLDAEIRRLEWLLRSLEMSLQRDASRLARYGVPDDLVTGAAPDRPATVPKMEVERGAD